MRFNSSGEASPERLDRIFINLVPCSADALGMSSNLRRNHAIAALVASLTLGTGLFSAHAAPTTTFGSSTDQALRVTASAPSTQSAAADPAAVRKSPAPARTSPTRSETRVGSSNVARAGTPRQVAPRSKPVGLSAVTPTRGTIYIRSYLNRPGSQAAVDTGKLVLWWNKPLWLAGHNYAGWQWLAFVPTGTKIIVTQGEAAGTYIVTGHKRLNRQSGPLPRVLADLVLQTCVGRQTGLTLLRRL